MSKTDATMRETIRITALGVLAHIGVPDEERAVEQRLEVDLELVTGRSFEKAGDDIAGTVDYAAVAAMSRAVAAERPRALIETLAADLSRTLLAAHALESITVTVRKFILPDCGPVAVTMHRCS